MEGVGGGGYARGGTRVGLVPSRGACGRDLRDRCGEGRVCTERAGRGAVFGGERRTASSTQDQTAAAVDLDLRAWTAGVVRVTAVQRLAI